MINNTTSKIIFYLIIVLGTFISISSTSWIGIWIGLEINLLSFIPLIIDNKNIFSNESSIKYFLVQVFASIIFLFRRIFYIIKITSLFNLKENYENYIINATLLLKLGAAPFHFWFPNVIEGLSWNNSLLILTWQKLTPLIILSYSKINYFILIFIIISSIIGAIGGLNQTSIRKLIAFSSINHIRWMLLRLIINNILWIIYFILYIILNIRIIIFLKITNLFNLNQFFLFNNNFSLIKFCFIINLMSLGGLPPFIGFFPKWIIIENLILNKNIFITFLTIIITLITLFFYVRLSFSAFLFTYPSLSWNIFIYIKNSIIKINLIINFLIIFILLFLVNWYYLT